MIRSPMLSPSGTLVATLLCLLLLSACASGRRSIELPIAEPATTTAASRGAIYIGSIADTRSFENKPSSPSTPSIDGDVTSLTPEQRAGFIGRQRAKLGNAKGDVVLANNGTITGRMHALLAQGLRQHGYSLSDDPGAPVSATMTVYRFWSWIIPEMVVMQYNAQIAATLQINRYGKPTYLKLDGSGVNMAEIYSDDNFQLAYSRAFDDFLAKLDKALTAAGL